MPRGLSLGQGFAYVGVPLLGAVAVAAYLRLSEGADTGSATRAELEKRLAALEGRALADRRQLETLRRAKLSAPKLPPTEPAASAAVPVENSLENTETEGPTPPAVEPYTLERQAQYFHDYFEELDLLQKLESRDNHWASETESEASKVLEQDALEGSHLESARCSETLCRFEVAHDDENARAQFGMLFLGGMRAHVTQATIHGPRGSRKSTVYAARNGYDLPPPSIPPHG